LYPVGFKQGLDAVPYGLQIGVADIYLFVSVNKGHGGRKLKVKTCQVERRRKYTRAADISAYKEYLFRYLFLRSEQIYGVREPVGEPKPGLFIPGLSTSLSTARGRWLPRS
jgi:hypothetical protein